MSYSQLSKRVLKEPIIKKEQQQLVSLWNKPSAPTTLITSKVVGSTKKTNNSNASGKKIVEKTENVSENFNFDLARREGLQEPNTPAFGRLAASAKPKPNVKTTSKVQQSESEMPQMMSRRQAYNSFIPTGKAGQKYSNSDDYNSYNSQDYTNSDNNTNNSQAAKRQEYYNRRRLYSTSEPNTLGGGGLTGFIKRVSAGKKSQAPPESPPKDIILLKPNAVEYFKKKHSQSLRQMQEQSKGTERHSDGGVFSSWKPKSMKSRPSSAQGGGSKLPTPHVIIDNHIYDIHLGSRGGHYIIVNGNKKYIKSPSPASW